jgi:hypothetical protein
VILPNILGAPLRWWVMRGGLCGDEGGLLLASCIVRVSSRFSAQLRMSLPISYVRAREADVATAREFAIVRLITAVKLGLHGTPDFEYVAPT